MAALLLSVNVSDPHLVDSRHFGSFIEQQLHNLNVPHLSGFDQRSLSILENRKQESQPYN